jgi:ceramide glucosyltransferase
MTLIKPVRGLDDGMRENFETIVSADESKVLQVLIAIETPEDPAYAVARDFAQAHPDRDISVVLTGPAGPRMGKIHNMIEALPRAKHRFLIFSDADTRATRGLLEETSRAFRAGHDAAYALPYHAPARGLGGLCFLIAFNHFFCVPAALAYRLGFFHFYAGAWMAYTKEALEKVGGLEPFAHIIADDASIGLKVSASGARKAFLRVPVRVSETGTSPKEAFEHLAKWCTMGRWVMPEGYLLVPLLTPGVMAVLCWALGEAGGHAALGRGLLAAYSMSRVAAGFIQDKMMTGRPMALPRYLALALADLGVLVFWAAGFRSRLLWRGRLYRLSRGGVAKVLSEPVPA